MIQGAALRPPILGQYHLKKFWLKKKEIEDAEERLNKPVIHLAESPSSSSSSLPSMSATATPCVQRKRSPPPSALPVAATEGSVFSDGGAGSPSSALLSMVHSSRDAEPQGRRDPSATSPRSTTGACADCKTEKTPLWRNGPLGPKSLCNACGIRYKKLGKRQVGSPATAEAVVDGIEKKRKKKMMAKRWMRDEEEGALLLMALSSRQPLWTH